MERKQNSKKRKNRKYSRKKVVLIERTALFLAAVLSVFLICIFGVRKIASSGNGPAKTVEMSEHTEQTETGAKEPDHYSYSFSFAGDCTIGSLLEWQGSLDIDFQSVVKDDYAYPLSHVRDIFDKDDLTVVNLEGTFTNSTDAVEKPYRFKADPAYVRVLTEGSVEAVSTANNHSGDFKEAGLADTIAALDSAGILHTGPGGLLIRTLDGGLTIGIVSYNTVDSSAGEWQWRQDIRQDIDACKEAGCRLIIGFMHWGTVEYLTEPEAWEVQLAHDMADWGCDLIVGGHAHILQRMEYYNDVPIFYSMGNFCFGGNTGPDDMDSVIVQAQYEWNRAEATLKRSGLRVIPCEISTRKDRNDYCPTPCEEGSEDYQRILGKLQWNG